MQLGTHPPYTVWKKTGQSQGKRRGGGNRRWGSGGGSQSRRALLSEGDRPGGRGESGAASEDGLGLSLQATPLSHVFILVSDLGTTGC